MKKFKKYAIAFGAVFPFMPVLALAASEPRTLIDLIGRFTEILSALIPLLFAAALVGFLWGVAKFILQADNEEKRKEGRQIMIWGIIGLFAMTAVWGLVLVLGETFGVRFLKRLPESGSGAVNIQRLLPSWNPPANFSDTNLA